MTAMSKRRRPVVAVLASAATFLAVEACSETGPDAEARQNGCIGASCFDSSVAPAVDGGAPPTDSAPPTDAPVTFGDPLAGTTRIATLVKGGYNFVEGPVWVGGKLLFSDTSGNTIHQMAPGGAITPFRTNSNGANGNAVDKQGRLYTCESTTGKVVRTDATLANPASIADTFNAKPFNAPNDVIVRDDGTVFFTDPFYGNVPDGGLPQDKMAVYRVPAGGAPAPAAAGASPASSSACARRWTSADIVSNASCSARTSRRSALATKSLRRNSWSCSSACV